MGQTQMYSRWNSRLVMRVMRVLLALLVFGTVLAHSRAEAQVVVAEFEGRRASTVRSAVVSRLQRNGINVVRGTGEGSSPVDLAASEGASVVVTAQIRRRGRRWRASAEVFDASGSSLETVTATARGARGLGANLARALSGPLEAALQSGGSGGSGGEEAPPVAAAEGVQRVAVASLSGRGGSRVRNRIIRALSRESGIELIPYDDLESLAASQNVDLDDSTGLSQVAAELGLAAVVEGRVSRVGRRYAARIDVREGRTGESVGTAQFRGRSLSAISRTARRDTTRRIMPLITQAQAPTVVEDEPDESDDTVDDEGDEDPSDGRPRFTPRVELPIAFEITFLGSFYARTLEYFDDKYERLPTYSLPGWPSLRLSARWYPGAHLTDGWLSRIGLEGSYERALGIRTVRNSDDRQFTTSSQAFFAGVRVRYPIDLHEVSAVVGYGGHSFLVGSRLAGGEANDDNLPRVPGTDYRFVRLGVEGRAALGPIRATAYFNFNIIFDAGGIDDETFFPLADVGSIDLGGSVGYLIDVDSVDASLEIFLGVDLRRYYFTTNVQYNDTVEDPFVVGGILDQYVNYNVGLTWRQ